MTQRWGDAGCTLAGGRYRLISRAGSGGTAVVWRAMDTVLNREVAIKLLNTDAEVHTVLIDRLRAEAQAIAQLKHRHVTSIYDFGQDICDDGSIRPFVVMELVNGVTLQELMANGQAIGWARATAVAAQVASALAYAHDRGIVHRDVSCANIILTDDGVKVLDFGIAALLGQPDSQEGEELLGTPAYIAPERLRTREAPVAPAADVYGLGAIWYHMMAGEMPWKARTATGLIQAHLVYMPAPLPPIQGLPARLRELCMACLAKNPLDRPTSRELASELARYGAGGVTAGQTIISGKPRRRRAAFIATGIAATAAAIALAGAVQPGGWGQSQTQVPQAIASAIELAPATGEPPSPAPSQPDATPITGGQELTRPVTKPSSAAPTPAEGQLVRAAGGTVRVTCVQDRAQVLNVTVASGYIIKDLKAGPADEVHVVLRSPQNESDIKVTCAEGAPVPVIREIPK